MTGAERKAARLQREAAAWNAMHPVGTPVRYWRRPALRGEDPPTGEGVVLSPAVAKHDHVSVAVGECVALSILNVEALTVPLRVAKPRRAGRAVRCTVCGEAPTVADTGLCGPCTFGEAGTAGGSW